MTMAPPAVRGWAGGRPSNPHGRTIRMTAITTNIMTSDALGSTRTPNASMTPMTTAASSAPGTEPMPPTTTTTNASVMIDVSITLVSACRGTWSAPPSPARNEPRTNTEVKSRA